MKNCFLIVTFFVGGTLCLLIPQAAIAQSENKSPQMQAEAEEEKMASLPLTQAPGPPEWGKHIKDSSGELKFRPNSDRSFVGALELSGLEKKKAYMLCLNGKEGSDGNELLIKYGKDGKDGKYDFQTVQADNAGSVKAKISLRLPASHYNVKFFVKDIADNHSIVLYNNDLRFEVGSTPNSTEPRNVAAFSRDRLDRDKDNPRQTKGHIYRVTVVISEEGARLYGFKVAVAPHNAPGSCWIQSAVFVGAGRQTQAVFLGMDQPTKESYDLLLLRYDQQKQVPRDKVPLDELKNKGFEIIDRIDVERTE